MLGFSDMKYKYDMKAFGLVKLSSSSQIIQTVSDCIVVFHLINFRSRSIGSHFIPFEAMIHTRQITVHRFR